MTIISKWQLPSPHIQVWQSPSPRIQVWRPPHQKLTCDRSLRDKKRDVQTTSANACHPIAEPVIGTKQNTARKMPHPEHDRHPNLSWYKTTTSQRLSRIPNSQPRKQTAVFPPRAITDERRLDAGLRARQRLFRRYSEYQNIIRMAQWENTAYSPSLVASCLLGAGLEPLFVGSSQLSTTSRTWATACITDFFCPTASKTDLMNDVHAKLVKPLNTLGTWTSIQRFHEDTLIKKVAEMKIRGGG